MYKPATIKDIALALKLSPSTVSRALRDGYEISVETKRIVMEYAQKVNYKSNPIALSLKNRRTYSIGIVVPKLANSFFPGNSRHRVHCLRKRLPYYHHPNARFV
ncbi:LacI family DNA-binding transcriptional regulator [Mucilaginibacter antarcticus]|uniref:LacI family DNA-binding transcriptional regulator n=1 Tax=Mucilaginibacter antarcticus TaxID=1855725 RepID=UPI00363D8912